MIKLDDGTSIDISTEISDITKTVLTKICEVADKNNIDRDDTLKYFANLISTFSKISTIKTFEVGNSK